MKKTLGIAVIVLIVLGGIYLISSKSSQQPQELEKVTLSQAFEVFLYAPLYVAQDKSLFAKEGLEVSITTAGGPDKAFASLLSNDAQFALGDPTVVAISGEKGQPGKIVAGILRGVPFWGVAKNEAIKEITTPTELNGYSVATTPAPSTAYTLQTKMFNEGGIQPNIKETQSGTLLAALEANQVDIALELEPNVSTAVKNGAHIVYALNDQYPDFALTGLMVLPEYEQQNKETIQKMVNALQEALTYIRTNPEEATEIMIRRFPQLDKEVALEAMNRMIASNVFPPDTTMTRSGWETATQLRLDVGNIKNPASYETYITNSFAEKAQ